MDAARNRPARLGPLGRGVAARSPSGLARRAAAASSGWPRDGRAGRASSCWMTRALGARPILVGSPLVAMRMRQSLAQLEQQFRHETELDRTRRETLRRNAAMRSRKRHRAREKRRSSIRFWMLVLSLIATAVIVTVAMFETLYYLLG
jgi:hypothetical protein